MAEQHRGHPIHQQGSVWVYSDTGLPVSEDVERQCGACRGPNRPDGHDACLGKLPGAIIGACCGHGMASDAYIQLRSGLYISGEAVAIFARGLSK